MKSDVTIPAMMQVAINAFVNGSRRSGKTTRLLQSLKNDDVVIFPTITSARYAMNLYQEMYGGKGYRVRFIAINPNLQPLADNIPQLQDSVAQGGTIHFDHTWYESFYYRSVELATAELDGLLSVLSLRKRHVQAVPVQFDESPKKDDDPYNGR